MPKLSAPRGKVLIIIVLFALVFSSLIFYQIYIPGSLTTNNSLIAPNSLYSDRSEANIAFFIQSYSKSLPLLPSLLQVIWHPDNIYVIHLDAKTPSSEFAQINRLIAFQNYSSNVILMPSEHVSYLGITTVLNTLNGISAAQNASDQWDYFINISGSDYPLVRPAHLRRILASPDILSNRLNFVQATEDPPSVDSREYNARFESIHIDASLWTNLLQKPRIAAPLGPVDKTCKQGCLWNIEEESHPLLTSPHGKLPLIKTEAWVILHRSFAEYCTSSPLSRRMISIMTNIPIPEEYFFGTLLSMAPEFNHTSVYDSFRSIFWTHKPDDGPRPPVIDKGGVPNIYAKLRTSGDLFVRKRSRATSPVRSFIDKDLMGIGLSQREWKDFNNTAVQYAAFAMRRVRCRAKHRVQYDGWYPKYEACLTSDEIE